MRKHIILLTVIFMLSAVTSCARNNSNSVSDTAEKLMSKAYPVLDITDNAPVSDIESISYLGEQDKYLLVGYDDSRDGVKLYVTDAGFAEFTSVELKTDEQYYIEKNCITSTDDGNIAAFFRVEGDADEQETAFPTVTYHICVFDHQGEIISDTEISNTDILDTDESGYLYIGNLISLGDDYIIGVKGIDCDHFYLLSSDGDISNGVFLGENAVLFSTGKDTDGNIAFSDTEGNKEVIRFVGKYDHRELAGSLDLDSLNVEMGTQTLTRGNNEYRLFISSPQSLYGVRQDSSAEEVINWSDSGLNGQYIRNVLALSNGDFIVLEDDWSSDETARLYLLSRNGNAGSDNVRLIKLAAENADNQLFTMVDRFNKTHKDYHIKVMDYQKYYETGNTDTAILNTPEKQLKMDIATGEQFDIMVLDSEGQLLYNLADKEVFTDIRPLMAADNSIVPEDILPNILKVCEENGKINWISPMFSIQTIAAKTKYVSGNSWTIDEMIRIYSELDDKMKLLNYGISKSDVFMTLFVNYNNPFVDYKKHKCAFDSTEFINALKFVNGLELDNEINWENADHSEYETLYDNMGTACLNDKALLQSVRLTDARDYTRTRYGTFGEDISLIGFPTSSGCGAKLCTGTAYAITDKSEYKDVCWEFIKQYFSDDYYNEHANEGFPSLKKFFDKKLDEAMCDPFLTDENGNTETYKDSVQIGTITTEIPNLTADERNMIQDYIISADSTGYGNSVDIYMIIREEIAACFKGENSAERTAEILQNRISLLLDESR